MKLIRSRLLFAALVACTAAGGLLFPFPFDGRMWNEVFNLGHAPAFFCLLLAMVALISPVAVGLPARLPSVTRMTIPRTGVLAVLLGVAGIGAEFLQRYFGRHASWGDVAANTGGLLAGWIWVVGQSMRWQAAVACRLVAIGILSAVCARPLQIIVDCVQQNREFPLLGSFERTQELTGWAARDSVLSRSRKWSTDGSYSLRIALQSPDFTGAAMVWPTADWSRHRSFQFDVYNATTETLNLIVKIQDREHAASGHNPADRFERRFVIAAGEKSTHQVELADIAAAPDSRMMQMNQISRIEFFCMGLHADGDLFLDNVRLVAARQPSRGSTSEENHADQDHR